MKRASISPSRMPPALEIARSIGIGARRSSGTALISAATLSGEDGNALPVASRTRPAATGERPAALRSRVAVAALKAGAVDYVWKDLQGQFRELLGEEADRESAGQVRDQRAPRQALAELPQQSPAQPEAQTRAEREHTGAARSVEDVRERSAEARTRYTR